MPLCPDCLENDRILSLMVYTHDEEYKGKPYVVLECITCGSSVRCRKEKT